MSRVSREYGKTMRRIEVTKLRGSAFREGFHDYVIRSGGVVVFPRLVASEYANEHEEASVAASGLAELDQLAGGGLGRGTSTLLIGPAGCGKTTLALRFLTTAAERGEHTVAFIFEETVNTLMGRAAGLGMDLKRHIKSGTMKIEHLDPAEMSPGEFVDMVRRSVEEDHARVVLIDSLNGFLQAMPGEQFLALHLHELLTYLNNRGILTLMVLAQMGLVGSAMQTPIDVSYLADNILVLRYFESRGEVRQAISMMKKRSGGHERSIRELRFLPNTIQVGAPLSNFQGILSGSPPHWHHYWGKTTPMPDPMSDLEVIRLRAFRKGRGAHRESIGGVCGYHSNARQLRELECAISEHAGAAVITEEVLQNGAISALALKLSTQPPWSDFPMMVLTGSGLSTQAPSRQFVLALRSAM